MTSQNNDSRRSINSISNYILNEQNIDIGNFTGGHLNESHLWKHPEQKSHQTWETSKLADQRSTSSLKFDLNASKSFNNYSNLKQKPFLKESNLNNSETTLKLPQINKLDKTNNFPLTDKEMAIHFLSNPFKGASKKEKFINFTEFEKKIIQKQDLISQNNLHGKHSYYCI